MDNERYNQGNQGTTLNKYIWLLKDRNVNYNINWEKIQNGSFFNPATGKCRGCLFDRHRPDPDDPSKNQGTTLSKYIWLLKDRNVDYHITWEKVQNGSFYSKFFYSVS